MTSCANTGFNISWDICKFQIGQDQVFGGVSILG